MSAQSIGPTAFMGVAWPRDAKPTHPGAAGGTVDQNWAKTLPSEAVWSMRKLKSESQNGNSGLRHEESKSSMSQFFELIHRTQQQKSDDVCFDR